MFNQIKKVFKNTKNFLDKISVYLNIFITSFLFLLIALIIFKYLKDTQVLKNNLLNLIILIIFFSAIYLLMGKIYYKVIKISLLKPTLFEKEFRRLWRKRGVLAQETKKIKYGSKKYKDKFHQIEKITKQLDKTSISFKSWLEFFLFSIYYGLLEGMFCWAIRYSTKYFPKAAAEFFRLRSFETGFRWYKLKKYRYIIDSFIYPIKKLKN